MTKRDDPHNDLSTPHDPKDDHESHYTSASDSDRVGSQNRGIGGIQNQEDHLSGEGAQTFKGHNSLVTRDPDAFEHAAQNPAYAGADAPVGTLSGTPPAVSMPGELSAGAASVATTGLLPGGGVGGVMQPDPFLARDIDPNPAYTPPSEEVPTHPNEGAAGLPAGAPGETYLESNLNDTVSTDKDRS